MSKKKKRLKLQKRIQELEQMKSLTKEEFQTDSPDSSSEKKTDITLETSRKPVIIEENLEQNLFYLIALIAVFFIFIPGEFLNKISIFLENLFFIK